MLNHYTIPVMLFVGRRGSYVALWSGNVWSEGEQTEEEKARQLQGGVSENGGRKVQTPGGENSQAGR